MTSRLILLASAAAMLAACSSNSQHQPAASLIARDSFDLCEDYFVYFRQSHDPAEAAKIRAEIDRRYLVPANEWAAIDAGRVAVGTSQCGVLAAWGPPQTNNQTIEGNEQRIRLGYPGRTVVTNGTVVVALLE